MTIAIIGAGGFACSGILSGALRQGHDVTAVVGNLDKLSSHTKLPRTYVVAMLDEVEAPKHPRTRFAVAY